MGYNNHFAYDSDGFIPPPVSLRQIAGTGDEPAPPLPPPDDGALAVSGECAGVYKMGLIILKWFFMVVSWGFMGLDRDFL